ncbi:MAG: 4Fe-4S dicluster domain-containing protein [Candidatus Omnitrophica bacterium]|nr:4Fe-4S dicluster domain-containing protein [Candidatus Omnitrophota bacterium]MCM8817571.1 4Fe-4S dicluster domain-containing protein [Candidatus Omnitrophota bacterium]
MTRKEFIGSFAAIIVATCVPDILLGGQRRSFFIRPPGSFDEKIFPSLCIRCGQCIRSCPARCLSQVSIVDSLRAWATPEIIPRKKGCILCQNCGRVCPTNAIRVVRDDLIKIGTARIYQDICLVWTHQKECLICLEYCPVQAIYLDQEGRPCVNFEVCTGCGLCEENCPVVGKKAAIRVTNWGERRVRIGEQYK